MNWTKLAVDAVGLGFTFYLAILFYGTFLELRKCRKSMFAAGFLLYVFLGLVCVVMFQGQAWTLVTSVSLVFLLGFYYKTRLTMHILLAFVFSALAVVSEFLIMVVQIRLLGVSVESIQGSFVPYAIGTLSSKLLALMLIYIVRFFVAPKNQQFGGRWFNLVMLALPLQSLMLCLVAQSMMMTFPDTAPMLLYEIIVLSSFVLLGITTFIMRNQLKSMKYKQEYEQAQNLLQAQMEHYTELYMAVQEIKAMRHSMKNEYIALSGLLSENRVDEALRIIGDAESRIESVGSIVDTGYPAVDAVVNSKIKKAAEHNAVIRYKMLIDGELHVDQFDISVILANALDNAIEAVARSAGIDTAINAAVTGRGNYVSIAVENHTSDIVDMSLKTTKEDKGNHGFGIRQMRIIAEKYDGDLSVEFDEVNMKFSLNVLLENRKPGVV